MTVKINNQTVDSNDWQDLFKTSSLRTGFLISLTRPMLEYLCAVADDVQWDRSTHGSTRAQPATAILTEAALHKRGLIRRKPGSRLKVAEASAPAFNVLTPAGACVVELVRMSGVFLKADAAAGRKRKKA